MPKESQATAAQAATAAEVSALLLQVLQNVNSAAQSSTPPTMKPPALAAIARFQALSADLRTLADGATSSFATNGGSAQAATARRRRAR